MIGACGFRQHPDPPLLEPLKPGLWQLACDYAVPAAGWTLMIPCGFLTDLASVPDWVRSLVGTEDLGAVGAIAHDALYQHGGMGDGLPRPFSRRETDRLFRDLMRVEKVVGWKRWVGWLAVRVAGWACWRRERTDMLVERAAAD